MIAGSNSSDSNLMSQSLVSRARSSLAPAGIKVVHPPAAVVVTTVKCLRSDTIVEAVLWRACMTFGRKGHFDSQQVLVSLYRLLMGGTKFESVTPAVAKTDELIRISRNHTLSALTNSPGSEAYSYCRQQSLYH